MNVEDIAVSDAISRIGLTPDGELLYLWLQRKLMDVENSTDPGALQEKNGERILARSLMILLSAGIDDVHVGVRSGRIIVFRHSGPAGVRDTRASRRARFGLPDADAGPGSTGYPGPGDTAG